MANTTFFAGIESKEVSQQGAYFSPGEYEVQIQKTMVRGTQQSGDVFLVETTVTKSSNADHPVGSKRTWIQSMKNRDIGLRAVLGFLFATLGLDPNNENDKKTIEERVRPNSAAIMAEACESNKFAGRPVKLSVFQKNNQKTGTPYNLHVWSPAPKA